MSTWKSIEVHQAEKVNGVQVQRLTIYYNCNGSLAIPQQLLDAPNVIMQTRKGVHVAYEAANAAM